VIVLLDTHALIWALENNPMLSAAARAAIVDPDNIVLASAVSAWEIAIKKALGRLSVPDDLERVAGAAGFTPRPVTFADARRLEGLPPHHRDPFDRMLVAQAMQDGVPIVTRDPQLASYNIQTIW
jgi:PIN domain nuclease of toxin-antitoxin system